MTRAGALFTLASLTPVPLILAGAWAGGGWAVAALVYMSVFAGALDRLVAVAAEEGRPGVEFPAAPVLNVALALAQFVLLAGLLPAMGGASSAGTVALALSFAAAGLFLGQIGNSNAHELVHAPGRLRRKLGRAVYASILFGHHASAHTLVHHVHVGTDADPNSARRGQSYWGFLPRAWAGSFVAGLTAESRRLAQRDGQVVWWRHPYAGYGAGAVLALAAAWLLGGSAGLLAFVTLAIWAQAQLLLSDYVQHYGLRRATRADGRTEPVRDLHSWNAPHWFTAHMMLHAPRHSDHHANPSKPFPALELPAAREAPQLPYSLPVMGLIALWPRLWRRIMDPRLADWQPPAMASAAE